MLNNKMKTLIYFFYLLLITSSCSTIQRQPSGLLSNSDKFLNPKRLDTILDVTAKILEYCPPQDCVVVGIGRSPTPFTAVIEAINNDVMLIPLSNFRYALIHDDSTDEYIPFLNKKERDRLYDHFDKYIINDQKLAGRKVKLLDFSISGRSIFGAQTYIDNYFTTNNRTIDISSLLICDDTTLLHEDKVKKFDDKAIVRGIQNYTLLPIEPQHSSNAPTFEQLMGQKPLPKRSLYDVLIDQSFDDYSPFSKFEVTRSKKVTIDKRHYTVLVNRLRRHILASDQYLEIYSKLIGISVSKLKAKLTSSKSCNELLINII
jgi:hypothetical protein